jgi:hypothetical protein
MRQHLERVIVRKGKSSWSKQSKASNPCKQSCDFVPFSVNASPFSASSTRASGRRRVLDALCCDLAQLTRSSEPDRQRRAARKEEEEAIEPLNAREKGSVKLIHPMQKI